MATSSDLKDLERALRIAPGNAAYWIRRADLLDRDLQSPVAALEHAAALNPFDADIWIRLGLDAEAHGDYTRAESDLLRAARVSRRYQPRWTLANYYFRRGAAAQFWTWARQALELEPEYPAALFQLCWRMPVAPSEIFEKAIPSKRSILRQYAHFLLSQNLVDAAGPVVRRLLAGAEPDDRDLLLEACDRLLAANAIELATAVWNTLCDRKSLTCSSLSSGAGGSLDGETSAIALGRGFAWHAAERNGISLDLRPGLIAVEFSGNQPESAEIVWRWLPVDPGSSMRVNFEYQTSGLTPGSGLTWQVLTSEKAPPLASTTSLSASTWSPGELEFRTPAGPGVVRLALIYLRPSGKVRIEGSAAIRALRIERVP